MMKINVYSEKSGNFGANCDDHRRDEQGTG